MKITKIITIIMKIKTIAKTALKYNQTKVVVGASLSRKKKASYIIPNVNCYRRK